MHHIPGTRRPDQPLRSRGLKPLIRGHGRVLAPDRSRRRAAPSAAPYELTKLKPTRYSLVVVKLVLAIAYFLIAGLLLPPRAAAATPEAGGRNLGTSTAPATFTAPATSAVPATATGQLALVFDDGKLASDYSAQAAASMLQESPFQFKTEFVGRGHAALTAQLLQQAKLYVEPGGSVDTGTAKQDFAAEIPLVNQFVNNGGRYLGLCAGGFVAGKEGFGVFPGSVGSYAGSPGTVAKGSSDQLIPIDWQGKTVTVDWEDGNYFDIPAGAPGITILGTYTNGLTAAAVATFGKGKSAFIGPHVESGLGSNPPSAESLDLGFQTLQALLN